MPRVYVSVGSNIDRERNIRGALHDLRQSYGHLIRSRVYETAAVGFDGDPFYNLVVAFDTTDSIDQVASELARIETAHGRRREGLPKYSARTLDLDILLYGDLIRHDSGFGDGSESRAAVQGSTGCGFGDGSESRAAVQGSTGCGFDIPRGEILERDFVLGPLAEIAPDLKHPEAGETFDTLWKRYGRNHPGTVLTPVHLED